MLYIRNGLAWIYVMLFLVIIFLPIHLVCALGRSPHPLYVVTRPAIRLFYRILGINVSVSGRENIPRPPFLLICNHLSNIDGPLVCSHVPWDLHVLIKHQTRQVPLIGNLFQLAEFVFVDRKSDRQSAEALLQTVAIIKKKAYAFLVFPEGTRSLTGKRMEFKKGGFLIAIKTRIPIVPARISGSFECMPPKSRWVHKGDVGLHFYPPMNVEEVEPLTADNLCQHVETRFFGDLERENHGT